MTNTQMSRQKLEHRKNGKYAATNPCQACGKSAGVNYFSHPETDVTINDELLCLCAKCAKELCGLPGPEAVMVAAERRAPMS